MLFHAPIVVFDIVWPQLLSENVWSRRLTREETRQSRDMVQFISKSFYTTEEESAFTCHGPWFL